MCSGPNVYFFSIKIITTQENVVRHFDWHNKRICQTLLFLQILDYCDISWNTPCLSLQTVPAATSLHHRRRHEKAMSLPLNSISCLNTCRVTWFWTLCRFPWLNLTRPDFFRIKYAIENARFIFSCLKVLGVVISQKFNWL